MFEWLLNREPTVEKCKACGVVPRVVVANLHTHFFCDCQKNMDRARKRADIEAWNKKQRKKK